MRLNAIKHHHLTIRADEEVHLLQEEMKATVAFVKDLQQLITAVEHNMKQQHCSKYTNGALHLLNLACLDCEGLLCDIQSCYSRYIDLPPLPIKNFPSPLFHPILNNSTDEDLANESSSSEGTVYYCVR